MIAAATEAKASAARSRAASAPSSAAALASAATLALALLLAGMNLSGPQCRSGGAPSCPAPRGGFFAQAWAPPPLVARRGIAQRPPAPSLAALLSRRRAAPEASPSPLGRDDEGGGDGPGTKPAARPPPLAPGLALAAALWLALPGGPPVAPDAGHHRPQQWQQPAVSVLATSSPSAMQRQPLERRGGGGFLGFGLGPAPASAKEMASGSGSRVNKDPESLLRYGLPIQSKEARKLQSVLEDIKIDIGSKRKSAALDGVKKARGLIGSGGARLAAGCRDPAMGTHVLNQMQGELEPLSAALKSSMDSFQGSEQERAALDAAYAAQRRVVDSLTMLEELMVPSGYQVPVPEAYSDLPQLRGRATVEMKLVKADKSTYDVSGSTFPEAKMVMVVDGYTAPVTAGNFVDLVQKGYYTGMKIQRSDGFVVQTGDPDGEAEGYVGPGSRSVGQGKHGERLIPLEIFVRGDEGPMYETTIEDDGRGGQATVLPFSSYGAMGWAREEYDVNSGGSQFFWLLFDSDLTPAGKNVLDGRYPCFGYVVEGADFLGDVDEGDVIVSAKVTKGADNLKQPSASGS